MLIPETKETLLSAIGTDTQSDRWAEFVKIYTPVMMAYLAVHFPGVPADDVVQESFVALMKCMPNYRYDPKEHGHFRNYLTGIVRHIAIHHLKAEVREIRERERYSQAFGDNGRLLESDVDNDLFRKSVYELALQELLSDPAIHDRSKNIFIHVAINGEKPDVVARNFGVTRNGVDQIKARLIAKLRAIANSLLQEAELLCDQDNSDGA